MEDGIITMLSRRSVSDVIDALAAAAGARGIKVFARVDFPAHAAEQGLELRPTQMLIFGDPKLSLPMVLDHQTIALDLPMRALAWQDRNGETWLTFSDPTWLAKRHELSQDSASRVKELEATVIALARAATGT